MPRTKGSKNRLKTNTTKDYDSLSSERTTARSARTGGWICVSMSTRSLRFLLYLTQWGQAPLNFRK